nr:ABC transporter ATP-binding protein [Cytobacillus citreus]
MKFQDVVAVKELNLSIDKGKLVSILGPSGCGKSTTLYMIAGIYKPTDGELFFNEKLMNGLEPEHREIGMVFQNYALYPHMTVLQNIMFPLKMQKVPKRGALLRAKEMADLVQIGHLLDRKPSQLSGGQQQRTAIARALVRKPKLLLFDEPLSNLDARLRIEMREEIRRIQKELAITTIFVTHDQEEAMSISDEVLLMNEGIVQQYSPPQEMYDQPKNLFVASFLGSPPINQLKGKIFGKRIHLMETEQSIPIETEIANEDCTIAIRPEAFYIAEGDDFSLTAKVEFIEQVGRDIMAIVTIGQATLRAFLAREDQIQQDETIKLGIRKTGFHVFSSANEQNLPIRPAWDGHKN